MSDTAPEFHSPVADRFEIWRIILGAIVMMLVFGIGTFAMILILPFLTDLDGLASTSKTPFGSKPFEVLFLFARFIPAFVGIIIALRLFHKRRFTTLLGPTQRANTTHFKYGIQIASLIAIVGFALGFVQWVIAPQTVLIDRSNLLVLDWMLFLMPMLAVVFIQIAVEELFFRGYLLQHLMRRFGKFWIAAIVPSLIFGLGHYDAGTFGANAWLYIMTTTVGGVILCSVTLRTGNLGAALGLHFANNIWATLTVGLAGNMDGMSLWIMDMDPKGMDTALSFVFQTALMIIAYLIWRRCSQHHLG